MIGRMITAGTVAPIDYVLTWLIQSTVLLAFGLVAGRSLRRWGPAVQSAWYRTTLVAVLLCPIASMAMAAMGFHGLLIRVPVSSEGTETGVPVADRLVAIADRVATALPVGSEPMARTPAAEFIRVADRTEGTNGPAPIIERAGGVATAMPPPAATPPAVPESNGWASRFVLALWLLGATALGARLLVGHRRMARLRSSAIPAEPDAAILCQDLARGMHLAPPAVLRSPFLFSPCLDGLRRPAILLPEDAEANLRETFIHELAHLARRDGLWNLLRQSATAVCWMQPLLWILSKRLEVTAEEVCDDYVVAFGADRGRYAGHLLELAERQLPPLAPSVVGMISLRSLLARRIARILDSTRTSSTRVGRRAIVATLLAGLAGTLLVGLLGVGSGNREVLGDEPKVETSTKTSDVSSTRSHSSQGAERKTVKSRVVDPDGKPVAGAIVTVARYRSSEFGRYLVDQERQEIGRAVADADGRFTLTYEGLDPLMLSQGPDSPDRWKDALLVASAPGYGPAWVQESSIARDATADKPLRLVRDDAPIHARLVDLEGHPVVGASVRVFMVWKAPSAEAVDQWLKAVDQPPSSTGGGKTQSRYFPTESYLPGNEPAVPAPVTTDAEGRFRLTGLGRDRVATLKISGPTIAFRRFQVLTRRMKHVESPGPGGRRLFDHGYYGADGTLVAEPGRPIEGVVRDADTKAPIPGALVNAMLLAGSTASIEGLITATTDAEGRYRLIGLPKASGHRLSVYPPLDRPYFITEFLNVPAGPGLGPVRYDIPLKRGIWISGRLTDARNHQPVQAAIHYYPFLANDRAKDYRNFDPNRMSLFWTGSRYRTDADGRFRVVGLPGRGIVAAKTFDRSYRLGIGADTFPEQPKQRGDREEGLPTYNQIHPLQFQALAAIDPPAGVQELHRDLVVEPSSSLTVRLVDPEGRPLTHVEAEGRFPDPDRHGRPQPLRAEPHPDRRARPEDLADGRLPARRAQARRRAGHQARRREQGRGIDRDAPPLRDGHGPARGRGRQAGQRRRRTPPDPRGRRTAGRNRALPHTHRRQRPVPDRQRDSRGRVHPSRQGPAGLRP